MIFLSYCIPFERVHFHNSHSRVTAPRDSYSFLVVISPEIKRDLLDVHRHFIQNELGIVWNML